MTGRTDALTISLAALLLAGCAGTQPRPRFKRPIQHGGHILAAEPAGESGFHDDIDKSQQDRYRDQNDSVPTGPPPDVSKLPEPVPKSEPLSLYGNKSPYTVLGRTYRVLPTAAGYDERGIASFYGNKFHGYKTSSLEDYDMYAFTAASKTLPLPSYARVTNLQNGKSVIVRVNDRGPFKQGRIIDLSYAAAVKIGVWPKGTAPVEVRGIDPGHPADEPSVARTLPAAKELPAAGAVTASTSGIYLQVGAFSDDANAERVAERLRRAHFHPVQVSELQIHGHVVHRVRVGPVAGAVDADRLSARIEQMGFPKPRVAVD